MPKNIDIDSWNKILALYNVPSQANSLPAAPREWHESKHTLRPVPVPGNRPQRRTIEAHKKSLKSGIVKHESTNGRRETWRDSRSSTPVDDVQSVESMLEQRGVLVVEYFNRHEHGIPIGAWASEDWIYECTLTNGRTIDLRPKKAITFLMEGMDAVSVLSEIVNVTCKVDQKLGYATVWTSLLKRGDWLEEVVTVDSWRREYGDLGQEAWVWIKRMDSSPVPSVPF